MNATKNILRSIWYRTAQKLFLKKSDKPRDYFTKIYSKNLWGGRASKSGLGSEGRFAEQKIELLGKLFAEYGINTVLDLGCGDFFWMKEVAKNLSRYHGVDIVANLIASNQETYGSDRVSFQCVDLSDPAQQKSLALKKVDLVICFDVFGHLLNKEVDALLPFILNGLDAKYFLVTNRREITSREFLTREKTRLEGIDLEAHPSFVKRAPKRIKQVPGVYPKDSFDLYDLSGGKGRG
jgi:hypothetical protein